MDRWGPSEDCPICGQPQSFGHFVVCPICERMMCHLCLSEHDCYDAYSDRNDEQGDGE